MTSAQEKKIRQTGCDARFDNLTRKLYATDASIYQIEPLGVAFPRNAQQASAVIRAALEKKAAIDQLAALGSQARGATPEEFTRFLQEETAKWGDLVKKANIKASE